MQRFSYPRIPFNPFFFLIRLGLGTQKRRLAPSLCRHHTYPHFYWKELVGGSVLKQPCDLRHGVSPFTLDFDGPAPQLLAFLILCRIITQRVSRIGVAFLLSLVGFDLGLVFDVLRTGGTAVGPACSIFAASGIV